jgi:hypothetical protein
LLVRRRGVSDPASDKAISITIAWSGIYGGLGAPRDDFRHPYQRLIIPPDLNPAGLS